MRPVYPLTTHKGWHATTILRSASSLTKDKYSSKVAVLLCSSLHAFMFLALIPGLRQFLKKHLPPPTLDLFSVKGLLLKGPQQLLFLLILSRKREMQGPEKPSLVVSRFIPNTRHSLLSTSNLFTKAAEKKRKAIDQFQGSGVEFDPCILFKPHGKRTPASFNQNERNTSAQWPWEKKGHPFVG